MKINLLTKNLKKTGPGSNMTIGVSLAIIAAVAMYNWAVSPQADYLQAAQQYSAIAQDADQKVTVLERTIQRMQKEFEQASSEIRDIETKFFSPDESDVFLSGIQPLAKKNNCILESLVFEPVEYYSEKNSLVTIRQKTANIQVTGQFASLSKLISEFMNQPQEVVVSGIDMRVTSDFTALYCNMSITIYVVEDKEVQDYVEL